jgi:hypothetical protein
MLLDAKGKQGSDSCMGSRRGVNYDEECRFISMVISPVESLAVLQDAQCQGKEIYKTQGGEMGYQGHS